MDKERCPKCGAVEVIPIVYGYPLADSDFMRAAEGGDVFLGGCVVHDDQPYWRCRTCGMEGTGDPTAPIDWRARWEAEHGRLDEERHSDGPPGDTHLVEWLWAIQDDLPPALYPVGVVPAQEHIAGTAAFPGGAGLYIDHPGELPAFPFGGVIVIAHDLDAEDKYLQRIRTGRAHGDPASPMRYWLNLYRLFEQAGLDPRRCFFTNVYIGLRRGTKPSGPFPGRRDKDFTRWSLNFLHLQAEWMRPSVAVLLGDDSRRAFGLEPGLGAVQLGGKDVPAAALAHPSFHPVSARNRTYAGLTGVAAEAALLQAAVAKATPEPRP